MKTPPRISSRRQGVALIITLLMVALLAFLVVAFFSRTTANRQIESSSKGGVRAEVLARSGAEAVVADLRAEIIAGSLAVAPSANRPVYIPLPNGKTIMPSRVLRQSVSPTNPVYTNLVKQSAEEKPFFTKELPPAGVTLGAAAPMIPKATNVTTDVPSLNSRSVSYARWQGAELTGRDAFLDSNTAPATNRYLPEWIMVNRAGIPAEQTWDLKMKDYTPGNANAVVGRFAYNVYDTGGLLDVNAIGYPKSLSFTQGNVQELKGSQTGADLSVFFTTSPVNSPFVKNIDLFTKSWKYLATGSTESGFMSNWRTTAKTGFLQSASGDNVALGRQDLIRLAKKKVTGSSDPKYGIDGIEATAADNTPSALPYLTHFSRESNTPSWFPTQDASAMGGNDGTPIAPGAPPPYAYKTNANNAIVPNRSFLGVLVTTAFTRADGTKALVGEPLVKTRFALSRLKGLGPNGIVTKDPVTGDLLNTTLVNGVPSPATPATIQRDFGLVWDATKACWLYVGPSGSVLQTTIKTLNGVVITAGGREPNFFELLKAGILSGSLGDTSDYESFCANIGYDSSADAQIIQIGANIIDQADSDSFPTRIAFGYEVDWLMGTNVLSPLSNANKPSPTTPNTPKIYSGVEDLPYIHSFVVTPYRRPAGQPNLAVGTTPSSAEDTQTAAQEYVNCWLQFVLWKPQQQAPATGVPTKFRILYTNSDLNSAREGMFVDYWGPGDNGDGTQTVFPASTPTNPGVTYYAKNTAPSLPDGTTVTFTDNASDFRAPTLLGGMGTTTENVFKCSQAQGNGGGTGDAQLPRGMWLGEVLRPERIPNSPTHDSAPIARFFELDAANDSRFELQYQDSGGTYRTYQRYDRFGMGTPRNGGFRGRGRYGFTDPGSSGSGASARPPYYAATGTTPHYTTLNIAGMSLTNADPRSQRFGLMAMYQRDSGPDTVPASDWTNYMKQGWSPTSSAPITAVYGPSNAARFFPSWTGGAGPTNSNPWGGPPNSIDFIKSSQPIKDPNKFFADDQISGGQYYKDMDEIARRGDGDTTNSVRPMQLTSVSSVDSKVMSPMLNHAFRSVGELSYVFRDNPWKTLDFFSASSADAALLDIFSVAEQPSIIAGKLNLNTRNTAVLQALLSGALREESTLTGGSPNLVESTNGGTISAATMAANLVANTTDTSGNPNTGPLFNVADIVKRLPAILPVSNAADQAIKTRREVIGRALAGAGQAHTWNLLVDVIAQSGRFSVPATTLSQFIVEGEKRYWLHVAIDRLTGQVVDQQLESVNE